MSDSENKSSTETGVQSVVMRLWESFRRTPRVRNAVERESAGLAAMPERMDLWERYREIRKESLMELVEVEASFAILQNDIRKARDAAVVNGDWKRADALESCLLGVLRAKAELASA